MGTREAQSVVLFIEIATEGCGDRPGTSIGECHGSCIPKFNIFVMFVPYLKKC